MAACQVVCRLASAPALCPSGIAAGGGVGWFVFFYSQRWLWGLPTALVEVLLLIYVLSHMGIRQHLDAYRHDLAHGDIQGAYHCAERHLSVPEVALTEDAEHMNEQVARSLLLRWFEYFFLMVFWYMVADVAGVLLAWFSLQYARTSDCDQQAWRYLHWLEWGPARLLGLTYGLAGNFVHALPVWQQHLWKLNTQSADVLFEVAHSALQHHGQPEPVPLERQGEVAAQQLDDWQQLQLAFTVDLDGGHCRRDDRRCAALVRAFFLARAAFKHLLFRPCRLTKRRHARRWNHRVERAAGAC